MSGWKKMRMAGRQWSRGIHRAIRGSWIRALAELITNADDSYTRLEKKGLKPSGEIYVYYERNASGARFYVVDEAEGMSADRLREVFEEYGGEVAAGADARGFFNRGAKDALLAMANGYEESVRDDEYAKVELRMNPSGEPEVKVSGPTRATNRRRRAMGIGDGNGTVSSFALPEDARLPHSQTVRSALAGFSMLRKIADPNNTKRRLILVYRDDEEEITFPAPVGETVLDRESLEVEADGFPTFKALLTLKKAEEDLDQTASDQRVGGLLVVDEGDAVLDLTLGRFDRDPAATRFFGEVKIKGGFKKFLRKEEKSGRHVLSDERNGLEITHPWVQAFFRTIEKQIEPHVEKERKARAAGSQRLTEAERKKQQRVLDELNRIAEEETRKSWRGDQEDHDAETPPAGGLELRPHRVMVPEGRKRWLAVVADYGKVQPGDLIYVEDESGVLDVEPDEIKVEREDDDKAIFTRHITISGGVAGQMGKLVAISQDCVAEATYEVVQGVYPDFTDDMSFVPDEVAVVDQKPATLSLYVKTSVIGAGEKLTVTSEDEDKIKVLTPNPEVDPGTIRGGVAKVRVRVRGMGIGNHAVIKAERTGVAPAEVLVRVRSKSATPPSKKGLFRGIDYNPQASETERVHYDDGNIVIHVVEPTVALHLGLAGEFRHMLDAQTLVAELVTQCLAQEVARRKVESGARAYFDNSPAGQLQEDLVEMRDLVHRYGPTVHRLVVDQQQLRDARRRVDGAEE